jgi:peptidoglycan/xylan/chitin deacetylase (PgdA/CDA1 family)
MQEKKKAILSIDLEKDHAGYVSVEKYDSWDKKRVAKLLAFLKKEKIPLNAFITGQALEEEPNTLKEIKNHKTSFYLHSYSHNLKEADSEEEVKKGIESFEKYFGKKPTGYRAPGGRISKKGLKSLEKSGFSFDSSTIISLWPNPTFLFLPEKPFYWKKDGLIEIPFTPLTFLGIPLTLSYAKLLGYRVFGFLLKRAKLPETVVFNIHLHDFGKVLASKNLSLFWKLVYSRNPDKGFAFFEKIVKDLKKKGYKFTSIEKVIEEMQSS